MRFSGVFLIIILFLYQSSNEIEKAGTMFTFILVLFGVIAIIIILAYILLTSKQE